MNRLLIVLVFSLAAFGQIDQQATTSQGITVSVVQTSAVNITTRPTLTSGNQGVAYGPVTLTCVGGTAPYTWSLVNSTSLFAGMALSSSGVINGTPTQSGTKNFDIKCQDSLGASDTKTFTLTIAPAATLTIQTSPPLPGAVSGSAYSGSVAITGGVPPYLANPDGCIITTPAGSLPSGIAVNLDSGGTNCIFTSTNVTAAAGTYNFTLLVKDSIATTATAPLSIVVTAASACGPPNYPCSNRTLNPVGTLTAPFALSDAANTTKYDTQLNSFGVDCLTQIDDNNTWGGGNFYTGNVTKTGGANDSMSSLTGVYVGFGLGGTVKLFKMSVSGNCVQRVWPAVGSTPTDSIGGAFSFSHQVENKFYSLGGASVVVLTENTIDGVGTPTHFTTTATLFDFANCPNVPTPAVKSSGTVFMVSKDDQTFSVGIGWQALNQNAQNTLTRMYVYNRTSGCSSLDISNGNFYAYCKDAAWGGSQNCPPIAATSVENTCTYDTSTGNNGVHEFLMAAPGDYMLLIAGHNGGAATLPAGGCVQAGNATYAMWQINTNSLVPLTSSGATGHNTMGALGALFLNPPKPTRFPKTSPNSPVQFYQATLVGTPQQHGGIPITLDDSLPWVIDIQCGAANTNNGTQPPALCNELYGLYTQQPLGTSAIRFVNNYAIRTVPLIHFGCDGGIMYVSQDGKWAYFASPMLGAYGTDAQGAYNCRVFGVKLD